MVWVVSQWGPSICSPNRKAHCEAWAPCLGGRWVYWTFHEHDTASVYFLFLKTQQVVHIVHISYCCCQLKSEANSVFQWDHFLYTCCSSHSIKLIAKALLSYKIFQCCAVDRWSVSFRTDLPCFYNCSLLNFVFMNSNLIVTLTARSPVYQTLRGSRKKLRIRVRTRQRGRGT